MFLSFFLISGLDSSYRVLCFHCSRRPVDVIRIRNSDGHVITLNCRLEELWVWRSLGYARRSLCIDPSEFVWLWQFLSFHSPLIPLIFSLAGSLSFLCSLSSTHCHSFGLTLEQSKTWMHTHTETYSTSNMQTSSVLLKYQKLLFSLSMKKLPAFQWTLFHSLFLSTQKPDIRSEMNIHVIYLDLWTRLRHLSYTYSIYVNKYMMTFNVTML